VTAKNPAKSVSNAAGVATKLVHIGAMDVSKPQGLFRRGNVWYYRQRIPVDVVRVFAGKSELKESLGTQDLAEAKRRRNGVAVKFGALFEEARRSLKGKTSTPIKRWTNAEVLAAIRHYVIEEDARLTSDFLSVDWASDGGERKAKYFDETKDLLNHYKDPSHDDTVTAICEVTKRALDIDLEVRHPREVSDNWVYLHRAVLELKRRELARVRGDYRSSSYDHKFADQIPQVIAPAQNQAHRLSELIERFRIDYAKDKAVGQKRLAKQNAALELLARFFGRDMPVSEISRSRCKQYRDILNELPSNITKRFPDTEQPLADIVAETTKRNLPRMAAETQATYLSLLKQLLSYAVAEEYIARDRSADLSPLGQRHAPREARNPFTIEQLSQIFNAPLYRGRKDDGEGYAVPGPKVIRGTRFWVPLIALYTGMRLNEICQLDVTDIQQSKKGSLFISVNANTSDKFVKNDPSKRSIPVHPDLVRIGFLGFVDQQKGRAKKLFPDLIPDP
jgi:integrase